MASGNTLLTFGPGAMSQLSGATPDARNAHPCWNFDDTTQEWVQMEGVMPRHYAGGGVTVYLHYALATATSGNMRAQTKFERIGDGSQDLDSDGFATANSLSDTAVPATSGNVKISSIAHANGAEMDSVAAGERFRLAVSLYSGSTSNATGDRQLVGVEIKET